MFTFVSWKIVISFWIFITADVGGQLGLFCGASLITIIEIIEYVLTNFSWLFIFFLLKILEMIQRSTPPQAV